MFGGCDCWEEREWKTRVAVEEQREGWALREVEWAKWEAIWGQKYGTMCCTNVVRLKTSHNWQSYPCFHTMFSWPHDSFCHSCRSLVPFIITLMHYIFQLSSRCDSIQCRMLLLLLDAWNYLIILKWKRQAKSARLWAYDSINKFIYVIFNELSPCDKRESNS